MIDPVIFEAGDLVTPDVSLTGASGTPQVVTHEGKLMSRHIPGGDTKCWGWPLIGQEPFYWPLIGHRSGSPMTEGHHRPLGHHHCCSKYTVTNAAFPR